MGRTDTKFRFYDSVPKAIDNSHKGKAAGPFWRSHGEEGMSDCQCTRQVVNDKS